MANLYDAIKDAISNFMANSSLTDFFYATLVNKKGAIKLEKTGVIIPESMVDIPLSLTDREVEITFDGELKQITIHEEIPINSKVIVIRNQGGQRFVVIGRLL